MIDRPQSQRILVVSDDEDASEIWAYALRYRGLEIRIATSPAEALDWWARDTFDLVIINFYQSLEEAMQFCRQLRREVANPILLFTSINDESLLLEAYEAGVDECVVKPIGHRLFLAKVQSWLRRSWTIPTEALDQLYVDDLRLDPAQRTLIRPDGDAVRLTNLEFRVLHLLMSHRGQVMDTSVIVDRVWGHTGNGDGVLLKNVIYRLRRKIEADPSQPRYLQTDSGGGYSFRAG